MNSDLPPIPFSVQMLLVLTKIKTQLYTGYIMQDFCLVHVMLLPQSYICIAASDLPPYACPSKPAGESNRG